MQIRTIVAKIVIGFDKRFAKGEDGRRFMEDSRDHFTLGLADLNLAFAKRRHYNITGVCLLNVVMTVANKAGIVCSSWLVTTALVI
jgi:hypothetical protein